MCRKPVCTFVRWQMNIYCLRSPYFCHIWATCYKRSEESMNTWCYACAKQPDSILKTLYSLVVGFTPGRMTEYSFINDIFKNNSNKTITTETCATVLLWHFWAAIFPCLTISLGTRMYVTYSRTYRQWKMLNSQPIGQAFSVFWSVCRPACQWSKGKDKCKGKGHAWLLAYKTQTHDQKRFTISGLKIPQCVMRSFTARGSEYVVRHADIPSLQWA